jgi:hypothetical protein
MTPRLMLDRCLPVTTTCYCSTCAYSTHNPELHPPRLCKRIRLLMHDERPDKHTTVSTKRTDREERTYPRPRNAGTRPRARNQAENRLVSFVDTPPRPPSTRRLGGDLFSLPAPKSPRQPTRPACSHCGTLGDPARTSRRCGCTAQIARMGRQVLYTSITPAGKILLLALPNPFETATSNTTNPTCMC